MKTLIVVGKPYRQFLEFMASTHPDIAVVAFQDLYDSYTYPSSVRAQFTVDMSSRKSLFAQLQRINGQDVIGVVTEFENYILPKTWIGQFYDVPVPTEPAAHAATDKYLMRQLFQKNAPSSTPAFQAVSNWREVKQFAHSHPFPLVLKPANLSKSILVSKSNSLEELRENFSTATQSIDALYQKYGAVHRKPQLLLEEFLAGPTYSVDLAIDSNGQVSPGPVVDLVMAREIGVGDNYNYSRKLPSRTSVATQEQLISTAQAGVHALGLTNSPAHVELVFTAQGPKIIEIGARFGGYRPRMYHLSYNLTIDQVMLDIALGNPIHMAPEFQGYSAVYELFPDTDGVLAVITHEEEVRHLASFLSMNISKKAGDLVGLSSTGHKFVANIFLFHPLEQQFQADCAFVENSVRVKLQASLHT